LFAVFLILCIASFAWVALGVTNLTRTNEADRTTTAEVAGLYGQPQKQEAPAFTSRSGPVEIASTDASATFTLDQRRKGLLWFATYRVDFSAAYGLHNPTGGPMSTTMRFKFPSAQGVYDGFAVAVDGREVPVQYEDGAAVAHFSLGAGKDAAVVTGYRTYGMDDWRYVPRPSGVGVMKDFQLTMLTDFTDVDFADGTVSPTSKKRTAEGWRLDWDYDSVVSGRDISLVMPKPLNPGPIAYKIAFFAPVSLIFFFAGLVLLTATRDVKLHPMHYGFLAAAFFAFHLLLSYLADQVPIDVAFAVASATSVVLVVGYLRMVVGRNRVLIEIAASQLLFLVLFSYSFFFEGLTGLAVTVGSVLTLGYFMAKTAKVDWDTAFTREKVGLSPPPALAGEPAS